MSDSLRRTAAHLLPHQAVLAEAWADAMLRSGGPSSEEARRLQQESLATLLDRLSRGEVDVLLRDEAVEATSLARQGASFASQALAIRVLDRCCVPFLLQACPDKEALAECLLALDELADRRLEILVRAQEDEAARRLVEAQEQAAQSADRARERDAGQRGAAAVRGAEPAPRGAGRAAGPRSCGGSPACSTRSGLMQEAADTIRARMNHTLRGGRGARRRRRPGRALGRPRGRRAA